MFKRARWIVVLLLCIGVPATPGAVFAHGVSGSPAEPLEGATVRDPSEFELVRNFAQRWGVTLDQAVTQLDLQEAIDTIGYSNMDEGFVEIISHPGPEFWIEYRTTAAGGLAPSVAEALADAGLLDLVKPIQVPRSLQLLEQAQEEFRAISPSRADTWLDTSAGGLVAAVLKRPTRADRTKLTARLTERLGKQVPVKWTEVSSLAEPAVGGGRPMGGCTAGFVVRRISGTLLGVSTAGHCSDSLSYEGASMTFMGEYYDGYGDVQWHYSNQLSYQKTVWDGSSYRAVTGRKAWVNMNVNDSICKYGKITDYDCGQVIHRAYCPSYVPSCTATYLRTTSNTDMAEPGDSGGPNFIGGTAWGLTSGHFPGSNDAIVMPQEFMQYIDIQVATQ